MNSDADNKHLTDTDCMWWSSLLKYKKNVNIFQMDILKLRILLKETSSKC
jgi:hypothetical protein